MGPWDQLLILIIDSWLDNIYGPCFWQHGAIRTYEVVKPESVRLFTIITEKLVRAHKMAAKVNNRNTNSSYILQCGGGQE